jgi:hypothetical protein
MAIAMLAVIFFSCNVVRHYKKAAADVKPVTEKKKEYAALIANRYFPNKEKIDSIVVKEYVSDTTKEGQLRVVIKQLLRQLQERTECPQLNEDSLYDAIIATIKKDTVIIRTKVIKTITDSLAIYNATSQYRYNYNLLLKQYNEVFDSNELNKKEVKELRQYKESTNKSSWLLWQLIKKNWWILLTLIAIIILLRRFAIQLQNLT